MPRQRTRTPEVADGIAAAALEIVRAEGADGLTTRRAAAAAGTNIAALGQLFGGRDGLVNAVALRGFALLVERLPRADGAPREVLTACARAYRSFAADEPALVDVMFARPLTGPIPPEHPVHECRRVLVDAFAALAASADRGDVEALALGFGALLEGLATKDRHGLLGPTAAARDRAWTLAVAAYADGAAR
ncbi:MULTISPECIES: TetR/AcrR family transcriptional regulator [Tsukamurella]|uniref:TetR family transcriptional regulator n=2 Tax=Tsukamurella TaxID=2060 RepID=A0A5C5S4J8_9ACTN|nr:MULTISPECIES: WHG domain-containing protein [Tsukamurella]NMD55114.1 TetR family transcriptional regulator [Tsukamurella columbiensis]TWS30139.1 TetR family transcriptional regulator [Tsukamurella conjunctivitidis]